MSIKTRLKRKLNSPANILLPIKIKNDLEMTQFFNKILNNMYEMYNLFTKDEAFTEIDTDFTTDGFTNLIVTDTATITLNANPLENEVVTVKSLTTNNITIDGNGKNIDGAATLLINTQYDNIKLVYIKSQDIWGTF